MTHTKKLKLNVENANAAGIDVGSTFHAIAVGQNPKHDVRGFGVYTQDHEELCLWLKERGVKTVAMESTGDYWQTLYNALEKHNFKVLLVNGKYTKNAAGKKSDVQDCIGIYELQTIGRLPSCFLPDESTDKIRTITRQRKFWIERAGSASQKMQHYLKLQNFRLDIVVNDVCGLTGMKIIRDICKGIDDPEQLSQHRHPNCKKTVDEIKKALKGNGREECLFALNQELSHYDFCQRNIKACDEKLNELFNKELQNKPQIDSLGKAKLKEKKVNKNDPKIKKLRQVAYQYFGGIDLMDIEGISHSTIITIMSEIGPKGFLKFPSAKHFASWLRIAPNNKISGGKVLNKHVPKGSNRLKIALLQAANTIGNKKGTHLSNCFQRIAYRKGRHAANCAIARKLAVIIWNMVTKSQAYNPIDIHQNITEKQKLKFLKNARKKIENLKITQEELQMLIT